MKKPKILIIDDEEDLLTVLQMLLLKAFEVETAGDPDQALARLKGGGFDLILSDLNMPGASERPLVAEYRAIAPQTPVLCMSGFGPEHELYQRAEKLGAVGLLRKPLPSAAQLIAEIQLRLAQKSAAGPI